MTEHKDDFRTRPSTKQFRNNYDRIKWRIDGEVLCPKCSAGIKSKQEIDKCPVCGARIGDSK